MPAIITLSSKPPPTATERLFMIRQLLRYNLYNDEIALFYIGRIALNEGTVESGRFIPGPHYHTGDEEPSHNANGEYRAGNLTISTTYHGSSNHYPKTAWTAIDSDTYDGAPDAKPPFSCMGYGDTEAEAIVDLMAELFASLTSL